MANSKADGHDDETLMFTGSADLPATVPRVP